MQREIGSNFWEYKTKQRRQYKFWWEKDLFCYYFKSGRNAMKSICTHFDSLKHSVLLPAYLCETEVDSWRKAGWEIFTYQINRDFSIDLCDLVAKYEKVNPSILLVQSYFGFLEKNKKLDQIIKQIKSNGTIVIEDITQNFLTDIPLVNADIYTASLRKFYAIPNGGVLITKNLWNLKQSQNFNYKIDTIAKEAFAYKLNYFKNQNAKIKETFRSKYVKLNELIEINDSLYEISELSKEIFDTLDIDFIASKRRRNYNYLFQQVEKENFNFKLATPKIKDEKTVPLYLCIYLESSKQRNDLRAYMASKDIYCPIIWPKLKNISIESTESLYIYNHILCIPIDQRYHFDDMDRIIRELKFYELNFMNQRCFINGE